MDLFTQSLSPLTQPLADRMRPKILDDVIGQSHVIGPRTPLGILLREGSLQNLIVWGPPGTGKTSFAQALSNQTKSHFLALNAVEAGAKQLKEVGEEGRRRRLEQHEKTLLFVDEIHRFNKAQQDVLLPLLEKGDLYLIGATTENPSYELNRALLSRCRVIEFKRLTRETLLDVLNRALKSENVKAEQLLSDDGIDEFLQFSDGDARRVLNNLEVMLTLFRSNKLPEMFPLRADNLTEILSQAPIAYDKKSQQHYDCISAFIKSVRGSDPDAAVYYLARMLKGGEDPVFIARRLIILASEDIGNAEPRALPLTIATLQAVEAIGMPEGRICLAQATTFLASCPKSNRSYESINRAMEVVESTGSVEVPVYLQSLAKDGNYKYPHSFPKSWVEQDYLPKAVKEFLNGETLYKPTAHGAEKNLKEFLNWLRAKV